MKPLLPVLLLGCLSLALAQGGPQNDSTERALAVDRPLRGESIPAPARYSPSTTSSFEDDCRACHDSGVPDRHHLLQGQIIVQDSVVPYPDANGDGLPEVTYGCLNCHGTNFEVVRDCVACHASQIGTVPDGTEPTEDPLVVAMSGPDALTLSWDPSCGVADTDYAIYQGAIGNFSNHTPILCSTEGATSATFTFSADSAYYLVAARNHWSEGSYGVDGDGAQRPPSSSACLSQVIGCPWP